MDGSLALQKVQSLEFLDNQHMKVVRLLALHRLPIVTITYFDLIHYSIGIFNMAPKLSLIGVLNLAPKCDIFYCTYAREYDYICTLWFKLFFETGI